MHLDMWDYLTFLAIFMLVAAGLCLAVFILGLPGRIARARKHPEYEAVNLMGWLGFLAVVPWIQAFIWAFKPTDVVDVRRFPRQEEQAIDEEYRKLAGQAGAEQPGKRPDVEQSTKSGKPS